MCTFERVRVQFRACACVYPCVRVYNPVCPLMCAPTPAPGRTRVLVYRRSATGRTCVLISSCDHRTNVLKIGGSGQPCETEQTFYNWR